MCRMWPAGSRALPPAFPVGAGMGPFGERAVHVRAEPSTEDSARPCPHSCGQHLSITRWRVMAPSCPWAEPSPHLLQVSSASHCEKSRIHPQKLHSASPGRQLVPGSCRCIWTISLDTPRSPLDGTGPGHCWPGLESRRLSPQRPRKQCLGFSYSSFRTHGAGSSCTAPSSSVPNTMPTTAPRPQRWAALLTPRDGPCGLGPAQQHCCSLTCR